MRVIDSCPRPRVRVPPFYDDSTPPTRFPHGKAALSSTRIRLEAASFAAADRVSGTLLGELNVAPRPSARHPDVLRVQTQARRPPATLYLFAGTPSFADVCAEYSLDTCAPLGSHSADRGQRPTDCRYSLLNGFREGWENAESCSFFDNCSGCGADCLGRNICSEQFQSDVARSRLAQTASNGTESETSPQTRHFRIVESRRGAERWNSGKGRAVDAQRREPGARPSPDASWLGGPQNTQTNRRHELGPCEPAE
jgi:hypothetical protein